MISSRLSKPLSPADFQPISQAIQFSPKMSVTLVRDVDTYASDSVILCILAFTYNFVLFLFVRNNISFQFI